MTVDTTDNTLRVHDGVTPGGHPLATRREVQAAGIGLPRAVVLGASTSSLQQTQGPSWVDHWASMMRSTSNPHQVFNLSVNQMSFYRAVKPHGAFGGARPVDVVADIAPDVLLVPLGGNDGIMNVDGRTLAQTKQDADAFFAAIKSALPEVKIIYLRPDWWDRSLNDGLHSRANRYFMPVHWTLGTTGPLQNLRAFEWEGLDIDSNQYNRYQITRDLADYVEGHLAVDATIREELWKVQRLGCTGADLLHPTPYGCQLLASAVMAQLRASCWSFFGWPGVMTLPDPLFNELDPLFNELLYNAGGAWEINSTPNYVAVHSIADERGWRLNPWAWYCRNKMRLTCNALDGSSIAQNEILFWSVQNGEPRGDVYVLAPTLGAPAFYLVGKASFMGDYSHVGDVSGFNTGAHLNHFRVGDEVLPPVNITITA